MPESASSTELDSTFLRGIAWMGSVKWIVQVVTWGTTILVARILSPEDYGVLGMAGALLVLITLVSESGLGTTVLALRDITPAQVAQLNGAALIIGIIGSAIAWGAAEPLGRFYNQPALPGVVRMASVAFIIASFRIVPGALLQRDLRFPRLAVIEGIQGVVQAVSTLVMASLGMRYWALVLGGLIGVLVSSIATVASRPYPLHLPRWTALRPVFDFTKHIFFSRIFWYSYSNSDFIVAGKRLGTDALGAYSYAWTLASMPVDKISAMVIGVTSSMFAAVQHDLPALRRYFLMVTEGLAIVAFPTTIGIALVAQDLVPVVFGEKWVAMIVPLQILAAYAAIRTITPHTSQILVVTGDARFQMWLNGIAAIVLPVAFYIGSFRGTMGIALAWVCMHPIAIYLPTHVRVLRRIGVSARDYLLALWPATSATLAMTAAVVATNLALPQSVPGPARLSAQIGLGAIAYLGIILLLHGHRLRSFVALWRRRAV
jgi:O-antigen/teichoic acid export membrane protein